MRKIIKNMKGGSAKTPKIGTLKNSKKQNKKQFKILKKPSKTFKNSRKNKTNFRKNCEQIMKIIKKCQR